jgi:ankyrin repeat protein
MRRPLNSRAVLVAFIVLVLFVAPGIAAAAAAGAVTGDVAPLARAAQQNDRPAIQRLLAERADVNASQADGMTALLWAAYRDDLDLVDQLLRAGANVRSTNRYGVTPLSLACTNANAAMVERLLGAGADPNTSQPGGETALMTAARTGRVAVVRALLARGANVHATESTRGQTALMWAAAEGHAAVVEELIKAGADFRTPLDSGFTPLLFAVREGHIGVVRALLTAGANVNETVKARPPRERPLPGGRGLDAGSTPLHVAVWNAHFELAAELLKAGADPNADGPGYTVLHALVRVRKPGVGDNDPAPDGSGSLTSLELVKQLKAHGADLDKPMTRRRNLTNTNFNEIGSSPFLLASLAADAQYMKALAELGADPLRTNREQSTPLMAAAGLGTRSPGEDAGTEAEVLEALQVALDLGADVNAVNSAGETAMHGAAYKNLPGAVEFLAGKGADINVWNRKNDFGWTPLTIARGYRIGNFKPSPVTVAAIERLMLSAGVRVPTEQEENAKGYDIYAPKPPATPPR